MGDALETLRMVRQCASDRLADISGDCTTYEDAFRRLEIACAALIFIEGEAERAWQRIAENTAAEHDETLAKLKAAEERVGWLVAALAEALDELEGLAVHLNLGPIGSVSEWRYTGRDAARIAIDKIGPWRAALAEQPAPAATTTEA